MSTPPEDSELRRLLDDAVSDVHPRGGTRQIRARARRPAAGRWLPLTLAATVATVAVIGGAAWLAQRQPDQQAATAEPGTGKQTTSTVARTIEVPVYYAGTTAAGTRLFKETHRVAGTTRSALQVAVDETLAGRPDDPDYSGAWLYDGTTATASADGDQISIDLVLPANSGYTGYPGEEKADQERALQALVWAADDATRTDLPVHFTFNFDAPQELFKADVTHPVARASADSVLSNVSITTPAEGAKVPTQFEVTGQAATFEANVVWELKQGAKTVRHGFTTASECCTLSPYKFTVTATPGQYTLVVHDTDESDGEGIGTSQDTKQITVE